MNTNTIPPKIPSAGPAPASFSPTDALFLLWRYKHVLLLGLVIGAVIAAGIFALTPSTFRSEAKLLVRYIADATAGDPAAESGRVVMLDGRGEHVLNTEIEILTSRDSVATVVDRIGLDRFPSHATNGADRAPILRGVIQNLHIDVPRRTNIIRVYYDGPDPELSVEVLKYLVEVYQEQHLRARRSQAGYEFLVQQTDLNRNRLAETEEELRKLRSEFGITSLEATRKSLAARTEDIRSAMGSAEADLAAAQARLRMGMPLWEQGLGPGHPLSLAGRAQPGSLSERLSRLEQRREDLLMTFRRDSTAVQHINAQIEDLRTQYSATADGDEPALTDEDGHPLFLPEAAEVAVQRARIGSLRAQLEEVREERRQMERIESRIIQLERNHQIQEDNYRQFSRSLEQARINEAVETAKLSSISVVQPATLVAVNHRPNLFRNMLLALGGGLFLSLVTIAGREFIPGRRIRRLRDLEVGLRLPVLLAVPTVRHRQKKRRKSKHVPSENNLMVIDPVRLPTMNNLQSYCDALGNTLLSSLGTDDSEPCIIGLTGTDRGVGVTTIAAGLAMSLAQQHETRVLLMDPEPDPQESTGRLRGIPSASGALDIMANGQGNVTIVEHNLFMLGPTLEAPLPPTALVRKWPDLMEQARYGGYRFVVLDLPPLSAISPSLRLLRQIHGTVVVVESDRSHWASVEQARTLVERNGGRVAGTVFNRHSDKGPHWVK